MAYIGHSIAGMFLASLAAYALATSSAKAGLFDDIERFFGGDSAATRNEPTIERRLPKSGTPLNVTVRPSRRFVRQGVGAPKGQRRQTAESQPKNSQAKATKKNYQPEPLSEIALMNPDRNPTWYLDDPTLRPGDIVVLKGEVLVFDGGRVPYTRADFSLLGDSRLSRSEREKLSAMAGLPEVARPQNVASAIQR